MTRIRVSIERILIWCARMVSNLDTTGMPCAVVVNVEVRSFVKSVEIGMYCGLREVVMDVCETEFSQRCLP